MSGLLLKNSSIMDLKSFTSLISQIAEEKDLPKEKVVQAIEDALAAAYKKDYGEKGQLIKAKLDPKTGQAEFWQIKTVVNEDMIYSKEELEEKKASLGEGFPEEEEEESEEGKKVRFNPERHIMLEEAKKISSKIKSGEELITPLPAQEDYGRIAAQTAKQVIMQRIREAEKKSIYEEYKEKEGKIISGVIQRKERGNLLIDVGKTLGILTKKEQVPGEFYRAGQRMKFYILRVEDDPKGPKVFLSRAYPKLVSRLFELEVPEISSGSVEIKSIAREAGSRTKIALSSQEESIDPIGAAVGRRGTRVRMIINELGGEKIDIIEHAEDPKQYISNSLSPAKVIEVKILPKNKALAIVPEDQLSLAIGKNGQNVRLAAKLTGWKIDVKSPQDQEDAGEEEEEEIEEEEIEEKERKEKGGKESKKVKGKETTEEVKEKKGKKGGKKKRGKKKETQKEKRKGKKTKGVRKKKKEKAEKK